jgi:16S rRNA (cytidine1402-2'-O)-methyltransferase
VRGEITLLVEAKSLATNAASPTSSLKDRVAELQRTEGLDEMDALKRAARERGVSKSEAYRELQRERARG